MKDQADIQTIDLFQPKRGRGRPVTGTAQTSADRQRAYRLRKKERPVVAFSQDTMTAGMLDKALDDIEQWRERYYKLENQHRVDIENVIEDMNRRIAAQKAQATKYRNENQALRDKIQSLEFQLSQAFKQAPIA
jgi:uncharacterized coiled-coil protein SlyX